MTHTDAIQRAIDEHIAMERNAGRYLKLRAALYAVEGKAIEMDLTADTPDQFDAVIDTLPEPKETAE